MVAHQIQALKDKIYRLSLIKKTWAVKITTQKEDDKVEILSGILKGKTTAFTMSLIIYNKNSRSDYTNIKDKFRRSMQIIFSKIWNWEYKVGRCQLEKLQQE